MSTEQLENEEAILSIYVPPSNVDILIRSIKGNPEDEVAYIALVDAYQESGISKKAAVRKVNKLKKEQTALYNQRIVEDMVHEDSRRGARLRTMIRNTTQYGKNYSVPINITIGNSPPEAEGEEAHHCWKGTLTPVKFPGAAIRRGYKLDYYKSTLKISVGADWVLSQLVVTKSNTGLDRVVD